MRRLALGFFVLVVVAGLVLSACGSSHSNTNPGGNSGTPATTVASGGAGSATTQCTIPQGGGGDHDADNDGGPNDNDGCR